MIRTKGFGMRGAVRRGSHDRLQCLPHRQPAPDRAPAKSPSPTGPASPAATKPTYVALVNKFNATHPSIKVDMTIQPWDSIAQKLPKAMATGSGPDIATPDYNVGTIRQYITNGLIAPIDQLLGNGPNQVPASVTSAGGQGRVHREWPPVRRAGELGDPGAVLQQDLVRQSRHHRPAATMAQLESDAVKLTLKSGSTVKQYGMAIADHSTIAMWPIFIWANGGDILTPNGCSAPR